MFISGEYGGTAFGGLAGLISRLSLTKYILSWREEVLAQDVHISVLVHGYKNLQQVTKTTKAYAAPEHNPLPRSRYCHTKYSRVSITHVLPPDKYPPITLSYGHPKPIAEDDLAQWPMIIQCPVLNHLDQRTPVIGWCRPRRPSRTRLVFVEARFMETMDDISDISLTATQIGNYPTLRKATFTQCDEFGPFWETNKTCTRDKMMVCTDTDQALVYL